MTNKWELCQSDNTCWIEMYTWTYFHTQNVVDILHIVSEKHKKSCYFHLDHWIHEMRSSAGKLCLMDIYTLQRSNIPNTIIILLIIREKFTWQFVQQFLNHERHLMLYCKSTNFRKVCIFATRKISWICKTWIFPYLTTWS